MTWIPPEVKKAQAQDTATSPEGFVPPEVKKKDTPILETGVSVKPIATLPSSGGLYDIFDVGKISVSEAPSTSEAEPVAPEVPEIPPQQKTDEMLESEVFQRPTIDEDSFKQSLISDFEEEEAQSMFLNTYSNIEKWYADRGGIDPLRKQYEFSKIAESLQEKYEELGKTAQTEEQGAQLTAQFRQEMEAAAKDMGLNVNGDGTVTIPENEIELYQRKYRSEATKLLNQLADKDKDPFMKDVWSKLGSGSGMVMSMPFHVMARVEDVLNLALEPIGAKSDYWNIMEDKLAKANETMSAEGQRYDQSITQSLIDGNLDEAVGGAVLQVSEQIPLLASLVIGNAAAGSTPTLSAMGAGTAAGEYQRLKEQDFPTYMKVVNSLAKGMSEVVWEKVGTLDIIKKSGKAIEQMGKNEFKEAFQRSLQGRLERTINTVVRGAKAPTQEIASEWATELTNDITDKLTVDPNKKIGENLGDVAIVSGIIGKGLSLRADMQSMAVGKIRKELAGIAKRIPENVPTEDRVKAIQLVYERNRTTDKGRIDQISQELSNIIETPAKLEYLESKRVSVPEGATPQQISELYATEVGKEGRTARKASFEGLPVTLEGKDGAVKLKDGEVIFEGTKGEQTTLGTAEDLGWGTGEFVNNAQDEIAGLEFKQETPTAEQVEPTVEQKLKDLEEGNVVSFTYKSESEVPKALKDKISSVSEVNGAKEIKVTLPKSEADFLLNKTDVTEEATLEVEEVATEPVEASQPPVEVRSPEEGAITPEDTKEAPTEAKIEPTEEAEVESVAEPELPTSEYEAKRRDIETRREQELEEKRVLSPSEIVDLGIEKGYFTGETAETFKKSPLRYLNSYDSALKIFGIEDKNFAARSLASREKHIDKDPSFERTEIKEINEKYNEELRSLEAQQAPTSEQIKEPRIEAAKQPTATPQKPIQEATKKAADTLRKAKFIQTMDDLSKLSSDPTAVLKVAWDGSVELAAKTIEAGGTIAQAVSDGLKSLKESDWYKNLSDSSKKIAEERFTSDVTKQLQDAEKARTETKKRSRKKEGVEPEAERPVRVRSTEKDRVEAEQGEELGDEAQRQQGVKIIESTELPKDLKEDFKKEGIEYVPRGKNVRRSEAKTITEAKMKMAGGMQQVKEDILNTGNGIKGDTRIAMAASYVKESLKLAAKAKNQKEYMKHKNNASDVLRFTMERSTETAQELEANKEISEILGSNPELIEDVYHKEIERRNEEFYEREKQSIKTAQEVIDGFINSETFKKNYVKRGDPKVKEEGITRKERRERGMAKADDALSRIASMIGAKFNADMEIQPGDDLYKAVADLFDGLLDIGVASTEDLINQAKVKLRKYLTSDQIDGVANQILKETNAKKRLIPKRERKIELSKEDENALVDKIYSKLLIGSKDQIRRLISDNMELLIRNGAIDDASFKELFAKAMGRDYVSQDVLNALKSSAETIQDVKVIEDKIKELFDQLVEAEKDGNQKVRIRKLKKLIDKRLRQHKLAVFKAGIANQFISEAFAKPSTTARLLATNIQGNLLTPASQLVNIVSNTSWMPIRTVKNVVSLGLDMAASYVGTAKDYAVKQINKAEQQYIKEQAEKTGKDENLIAPPKWMTRVKRIAAKLPNAERTRIGIGISREYAKGFGYGTLEGAAQLWTGQLSDDIYRRDVSVAMHPFKAWYDNYQMLTGKEKKDANKIINNFIQGTIGIPPEIMFRLLNLGDKPYRRAAERDRLAELGKLKGLKGAELERFIEVPDEESAAEATLAGLEATYQQDNVITDAIRGLSKAVDKQATENLGSLAKGSRTLALMLKVTTMPYVKTPTNILLETIDYAMPIVSFIKGLSYAQRGDRRKSLDSFARAVTGSMLNTAVSHLFATGVLSLAAGGAEDEPKGRAPQKVTTAEYRDKPPYYLNTQALSRLLSNHINGTNLSVDWQEGDEIITYKRFGIISSILMSHAEAYRGMTKEEIKSIKGIDRSIISAIPVLKSSLDQSFVSGVSLLINAINGTEWERDMWLVNTTKALSATAIPNTLRTYNQARDNYIRETRDATLSKAKATEKFASRVKNDFKASFIRDNGLPTKITIWGERVNRYEDGDSPFFRLFDITKQKTYKGDFGTKIFELYEQTGDNSVLPPVLEPEVTFLGKDIKLDPQTYEEMQIYVGTMLKNYVSRVTASETWNNASEKKKRLMLDVAYTGSSSMRSAFIDMYKFKNKSKLNDLWLQQEAKRKEED